MKSFLKYLLATVVGIIISSILLFLIFLGIIGVLISSSEKEVTINSNSILKIELNKPVPEPARRTFHRFFDIEQPVA